MKNLDWGGFAMAVLKALCDLDIMFWTSLINLDWGGFATTVYNALITEIGNIIGWFEGLDWGGLASTILTALENGLKGIIDWFKNLDWGSVGDAVKNGILGAIGGVGSAAAKAIGLQHGGLVTKPTLAVIGEAGPELVVPMSGIRGGASAAAGAGVLTGASAAGAAKQGTTQPINFNVVFNNATLTSQKDADNLSLRMGYKAQELLRRSGYAKG
jgi:hypothetical protein